MLFAIYYRGEYWFDLVACDAFAAEQGCRSRLPVYHDLGQIKVVGIS